MRVLLATDGSPGSQAAIDALGRLFAPELIELLILISVYELPPATGELGAMVAYDEQWREETARHLDQAGQILGVQGFRVMKRLDGGHPVERILAVADSENADLIVVGSHGRTGFKRWVLGSVSDAVVRQSERPVLVVRQPQEA